MKRRGRPRGVSCVSRAPSPFRIEQGPRVQRDPFILSLTCVSVVSCAMNVLAVQYVRGGVIR